MTHRVRCTWAPARPTIHPEFACTSLQHFLAARAHCCCHELLWELGVTLGTTWRICIKFTSLVRIEVFGQAYFIMLSKDVSFFSMAFSPMNLRWNGWAAEMFVADRDDVAICKLVGLFSFLDSLLWTSARSRRVQCSTTSPRQSQQRSRQHSNAQYFYPAQAWPLMRQVAVRFTASAVS